MNTAILFNKGFRRAALASIVVFGAFGASSSFAVDAVTNSSATVIQPIAITKAADLVFGQFAPGTGGSVTIATNGDRTATGTILSSVGPNPTAARFDVTGDNSATYSITWTGAATLNHPNDAMQNMTLTKISDLTGTGTTTGEVTSGTLSSTGAQSIYLGGTLAVGANQAAATYEGDVTVTVEYN